MGLSEVVTVDSRLLVHNTLQTPPSGAFHLVFKGPSPAQRCE